MFNEFSISVFVFLVAAHVGGAALAQDNGREKCLETKPDWRDADDEEMDHFEFTMGFIAGARDYSKKSFAYHKGGGSLEGRGNLFEPFGNPPYEYVQTYGLRYDLRLVVSYVRMTVGMDFPFAHYQPDKTRRDYVMGGIERDIVAQKIRPYELRFGIGGEYAFGRVVPYVDVIGEVDWVTTELSVDGEKLEFKSTSFGFSVRGGVKVFLREWFFISVAGDYGLVGDKVWDAELSLGFSFG